MLKQWLLTYIGTIALRIFATGDQEPLEFSYLQAAKPWVLELFLVTWKENALGAGGMASGIWTSLNSILSFVTVGKSFNLPDPLPSLPTFSFLLCKKGDLIPGRVAVSMETISEQVPCMAWKNCVVNGRNLSPSGFPVPFPCGCECLDTGWSVHCPLKNASGSESGLGVSLNLKGWHQLKKSRGNILSLGRDEG